MYYGITIGPVVDTLSMSSKPLGLWLASYLFSEFSHLICEGIKEQGDGTTEIIIPTLPDEDMTLVSGVGMYPDRIIFKSDTVDFPLEGIIKATITALEENIYGENYQGIRVDFHKYLIYHIVKLENVEGNVIKAFSDLLDAKEANQRLIDGAEITKLRTLLSRNEDLSKLKIFKANASSLFENLLLLSNRVIDKKLNFTGSIQLKDRDTQVHVKDIGELCINSKFDEDEKKSREKEVKDGDILDKTQRYYAIVQADGDGVGKHITNLENDKIGEFSKKLLEYSNSLVNKVKEYGGTLIYAGGDDLLAILPVYQGENNILDFCKELNEHFKTSLIKGDDTLKKSDFALSFGISIFYYKYPLYEAFKKSLHQLFGIAKQESAGKNCIAIYSQKHSGQITEFIVKNDWTMKTFVSEKSDNLYDLLLNDLVEDNNSVMYHMINNANLFKYAIGRYHLFCQDNIKYQNENEIIENLFNNYFSHTSQGSSGTQANIAVAKKIIKQLKVEDLVNLKRNLKESDIDTTYNYVIEIFKFRKFLLETAGKRVKKEDK